MFQELRTRSGEWPINVRWYLLTEVDGAMLALSLTRSFSSCFDRRSLTSSLDIARKRLVVREDLLEKMTRRLANPSIGCSPTRIRATATTSTDLSFPMIQQLLYKQMQ